MFKSSRIFVFILSLILLVGLLALYSSCHQKGVFIKKEVFQKQLLWLGVGFFVMLFLWHCDYHHLKTMIIPLYILGVCSLVFVLVLGRSIMGAQRWLSFGFFSFQPSEMAKIILIMSLAGYFSHQSAHHVRKSLSKASFSQSVGVPLAATFLLAGLILIQPDLGTAIVFLFLYLALSFVAGVRFRYLFGLGVAGLCALPFFWHFLKDYQKSRLLVFLNPNIDPLGAGYTVIQSKIAIGSGLFFGRGWMAGTQSQLNFLAERHTDFIFSVIGEEWGFLGSFLLLLLYGLLILTALTIASRAKDLFGRLLATGIASLIFFQVFVNISMNVGMCPVVGLPLPFISYGGSSLVISLAAVGILLSVADHQ